MRVARILWGLLSRPYGWALGAMERELGVSERTLLRYVKACREELLDARGRPLVELIRRGDRRLLRLADSVRAPDSTAYQALSFYFAMTVFQFLDGAGLEPGTDDLWTRFRSGLPRGRHAQLGDLRRKFYAVPQTVQDYAGFDERLDVVLQGLVNQRRIRIEEKTEDDAAASRVFDPYTLALAGGRLVLIGRDHADGRVVRLPLDAVRAAALTEERFEYPKRYAPETYADGVFGVADGDETDVSILIRNEQTVRSVRRRRLHPTQRFIRQQGGAAILSMRVRGTEELTSWILSLGPRVEVIAPRALRDDVRRAHAEAAALYGR
jgi:predicted DNA-binding transcriptional regulator YafY